MEEEGLLRRKEKIREREGERGEYIYRKKGGYEKG